MCKVPPKGLHFAEFVDSTGPHLRSPLPRDEAGVSPAERGGMTLTQRMLRAALLPRCPISLSLQTPFSLPCLVVITNFSYTFKTM